jgi:hypothetical protein
VKTMLLVLNEDYRETFQVCKHGLGIKNEQNPEVEPCKHLRASNHVEKHFGHQFV